MKEVERTVCKKLCSFTLTESQRKRLEVREHISNCVQIRILHEMRRIPITPPFTIWHALDTCDVDKLLVLMGSCGDIVHLQRCLRMAVLVVVRPPMPALPRLAETADAIVFSNGLRCSPERVRVVECIIRQLYVAGGKDCLLDLSVQKGVISETIDAMVRRDIERLALIDRWCWFIYDPNVISEFICPRLLNFRINYSDHCIAKYAGSQTEIYRQGVKTTPP